MRLSGVIEDARGLGTHDHVCWAYEDSEDLYCRVREFLAEGLAQGQRVYYVASGDAQALEEDLRGLAGLEGALRRGAVQVISLDAMYPVGTVIVPATQVQVWAAATQQAVAAGFTGLRLAAEGTPLVRTAGQLDAVARYEHLIDRYMANWPFSAMCAFHRGVLGQEAIAQLACLHPTASPGAAEFRLHAGPGAEATLGGELDLGSAGLFGWALDHADLRATGGELVIDAAGLSFMDHRNLLVLAEYARRGGVRVVLRTGWRGAARLVDLLGVAEVRVEPLG